MKVIKAINNNNLCVLDEHGKEQIVSGKGIGFGKKYGDEVDESLIQKTYIVTDHSLQKKLIALLQQIPNEYLEFTSDIVDYINTAYGETLKESLFVTLSDHIAFAIERKQNGMEFTNPLLDSIAENFHKELLLGEYCVKQMNDKLGVKMSRDEAGFIAMHIINARLDTNIGNIYDITKMINGCIEVSEYYYNVNFDKNGPHYERFVAHLKHLASRIFKDDPLPEVLSCDDAFSSMIKKTCNKHYKCALCIREYILKAYKKTISEDELLTLTIHLKKVSSENGC